MEPLLGDTLLTADGEKPTSEVLEGATAIGLYFSAHWCPPCRGFTPKLAEWYKDGLQAKGFRIVFVSSDKDENAFKEYFGEQPWAALPYAQRDKKNDLSKKFKVQGIPSFVILKPDGTVITTEGRDAISEDPTGTNYPWIPPTKEEKAQAIKDTLAATGLLEKVGGKHFGLYFSAHWCPPCRGFTPKLAEMYNEGLKEKLQIIFVSSDRDQASFDDYSKEMPWLSLPFDKRDEKDKLSKMCGVQGIPSFAIFSPDGTLITTEGRSKVMSDPKGETIPEGWLPQPFNDVNEDPSPLNEEKCVIALGADADQVAAVKAVAQEHYEAAGKDLDAMEIKFFTGPSGGVIDQVRKLTGIPEENKVILLDIPSDGAFYVNTSGASVKDFIADVLAGKAERQQLQK